MDYLYEPDWSIVRPIYKKLSDEFHVLTGSYGVVLDHRKKVMLDHLILGIDAVDLAIDQLPELEQRNDLTSSMLKFLSDDSTTWHHQLAPDGLSEKMKILKCMVLESEVQGRFVRAAEIIFDRTEEKRHTLNENTLIDLVQKEGKATAELPLSIMGIDSAHAFGAFFTKLCMLMGVADLFVDAQSDYQSKYIALRPKFSLYFKLNNILMKEGLSLIWNFPRPFKLLAYCIKFTWLLFTTED